MRLMRYGFLLGITGIVYGGSLVQNPQKIADDAAARALQAAGVHARGIVDNVNDVQDIAGRIQRGADEIQRAMYAPRSPYSRLKRIAYSLNRFHQEIRKMSSGITPSDIQRILKDSNIDKDMFAHMPDVQQRQLMAFSRTYETILSELDGVMIHALLHHTRQVLYDIAGMFDTIAHIRDYAGEYADMVLSLDALSAIQGVSAAMRSLARKLNEIMLGGALSFKAERSSFGTALMNKSDHIDEVISMMQQAVSDIDTSVKKVQYHLPLIMKHKNQLIRVSTMMQKRLASVLLKAYQGKDGQDLSVVAAAQLRTMLSGLHMPIQLLLMGMADIVDQVKDGIKEGIMGMGAFKQYIGFDLVNPVVRHDIDAVPELLRELSRFNVQMKKALTT